METMKLTIGNKEVVIEGEKLNVRVNEIEEEPTLPLYPNSPYQIVSEWDICPACNRAYIRGSYHACQSPKWKITVGDQT